MSERDELIEWCRTRAQQANLAYEMHCQRPHEFHGRYAVDVTQLCDALEEAVRENERLKTFLREANVAGRSFEHYYHEWGRGYDQRLAAARRKEGGGGG